MLWHYLPVGGIVALFLHLLLHVLLVLVTYLFSDRGMTHNQSIQDIANFLHLKWQDLENILKISVPVDPPLFQKHYAVKLTLRELLFTEIATSQTVDFLDYNRWKFFISNVRCKKIVLISAVRPKGMRTRKVSIHLKMYKSKNVMIRNTAEKNKHNNSS